MTEKEIIEKLDKIGLKDLTYNIDEVKVKMIYTDVSLIHAFTDKPYHEYYCIYFRDQTAILERTIGKKEVVDKLILPLEKREILTAPFDDIKLINDLFILSHSRYIITNNNNTSTQGIYDLKSNEFIISENNDYLSIEFFKSDESIRGRSFLITDKNYNKGLNCIIENNIKGINPNKIIPNEYDNIIDYNKYNTGYWLFIVEKDNKKGLHLFYDISYFDYVLENADGDYYKPEPTSWSSKTPLIFDDFGKKYHKIKNDQLENLFIEVIIDGKKGILDVIRNKFVLPPIFDDISVGEFVSDYDGISNYEKFLKGLCGYINGNKYIMHNNSLYQVVAEDFVNEENTLEENLNNTIKSSSELVKKLKLENK